MVDQLRARQASNDSTVATAGESASALILLCECGHPDCDNQVVLVLEEHQRARAVGTRIVSPPHEHVAAGAVIERHSRYVLVTASATPPRAG